MSRAVLHCGDVREVLATLPEASVQCVTTSPPYFGLRDYGTAKWEGGDPACDHRQPVSYKSSTLGASTGGRSETTHKRSIDAQATPYAHACGKCGAKRSDRQLGLEPTPGEYVRAMVEVFQVVHRVLRDDGVLWLNLGSSYASGDNGSSRARRGQSAPAYDSDGTEPQGSPATDSSYPDLCDGCQAALSHRIAGNGQRSGQSASPESRRDRDSAPPDCAQASPGASPLVSLVSTSSQSLTPPPAECSHCGNCGACLSVLRSSSRDVRLCVRRAEYNGDTGRRLSAHHSRGMDASGMAWLKYSYKPKDLVPTPWLVAMALQQDGWYLRSDIIWSKNNPMPESVTDRPTRSHEYLFLLTKSERYYFDATAIAEPVAEFLSTTGEPVPRRKYGGVMPSEAANGKYLNYEDGGQTGRPTRIPDTGTRNARSVWAIATQPYPQAHFATFPEELARRCILAGSSPKACEHCGAPWERVTERRDQGWDGSRYGERAVEATGGAKSGGTARSTLGSSNGKLTGKTETRGWRPTCPCENTGSGRCVVLDPFGGSGTVAQVATGNGRDAIYVDLNPAYRDLARQRIGPMLCEDSELGAPPGDAA